MTPYTLNALIGESMVCMYVESPYNLTENRFFVCVTEYIK